MRKTFSWLSVRLPVEQHEAIKAQAEETGLTVSDVVRLALDGNRVVIHGHRLPAKAEPAHRDLLAV